MQLYALTQFSPLPCVLIDLHHTRILIDCAVDASSLSCRGGNNTGRLRVSTPALTAIDPSSVDAVLLSNHQAFTALPFFTEFTSFRGPVYATEPALQFGRQLAHELAAYDAPRAMPLDPSDGGGRDGDRALQRRLYNARDVESSLERVQPLSYLQEVAVGPGVWAVATSSGANLGSANWLIRTEYEKIAYIAASCTFTARHPTPLDVDSLRGASVAIVTDLAVPPTPPETMLNELVSHIGLTLAQDGNVLIPCYPSGILHDLLEYIHTYLRSTWSASDVPMYFVSPVAETALAYSNIVVEWLSRQRQERALLPEAPFAHSEMLKTGALRFFPSMHHAIGTSYKEPCIVFAGHPSLRCGEVVHFLRRWGGNHRNLVLFVEPDFDPEEVLQPFQPLMMRTAHTPVDPRLRDSDVSSILKTIMPKHVVVPRKYAPETPGASITVSSPSPDVPLTSFDFLERVSFSLHTSFRRAALLPELALQLRPQKIGALALSRVSAILTPRNGILEVGPVKEGEDAASTKTQRRFVYGQPSEGVFVAELAKQGITDSVVTTDADGRWTQVTIPSLAATVKLSYHETHIETTSHSSRTLLRDILLQQLVEL